MAIVFFSDPHIGVNRRVHTTVRGRVRLQQMILDQAHRILDLPKHIGVTTPPQFICLGDLVDTYSNSEDVINDCLSLAQRLSILLAGNHDVANRADHLGTVGFLRRLLGERVAYVGAGKVGVFSYYLDRTKFFAIPHHTTQELFESALSLAVEEAAQRQDGPHYLLLHANYDSPMELNQTSLHLTRERAQNLLGVFQQILLGHEHQPRDDFDGRLKVIGNTFPTSFADISDKRILFLEQGCLRSHVVWAQSRHYLEMDPAGLLATGEDGMHSLPELQFLDIMGELQPAQVQPLLQLMSKLWDVCPQLLLVRNQAQLVVPVVPGKTPSLSTPEEDFALTRLPDLISQELSDTALQSLWRHYLGQVQQGQDTAQRQEAEEAEEAEEAGA